MDLRNRRTRAVGTAVALITVASAALLGWYWIAGPVPVAVSSTATVDGLTIDVGETAWMEMDHSIGSQGGYQMPDQMMPGAPTGDRVRLGVSVTLSNTQSGTQAFSLIEEFTLTGGLNTEPRPLSADTVGPVGRLAAGTVLNAKLYFDIQVPGEDDPPMYLRWDRGGDAIRIAIQLPGEEPTHQH